MIQKREEEYCKEVDDVAVLLISIVSDIKGGKSAGDITSGSIQKLIDAVAGIDQLGAESENRKVFLKTLGSRTGELADALLPKA